MKSYENYTGEMKSYENYTGTASIYNNMTTGFYKNYMDANMTTGFYEDYTDTTLKIYNWRYSSITNTNTITDTNYIPSCTNWGSTASYIDQITASSIYDLTWNISNSGSRVVSSFRTPGERMREILRSRSAPAIHRGNRRRSMTMVVDAREVRARSTLRNMLGDQSFRRFLRDGFVTVVPASGLTYRIYPGLGVTEVYDRGIMIETMCVILKGNFPPTDSLIMRYLLILNDEGEFSRYAVRNRVIHLPEVGQITEVSKSLPALFAELKAA